MEMIYAGKKFLTRVAVGFALLSLYAGSAVVAHASPFADAITDQELDHNRGTGIPVISNQAISDLSSTITGGTDTNTVSGANIISTGAFAGSGGLTAVIQNSGNNVGIQSATTVNVTFVNP